nr:YkvA family protein [Eggerthella timonensis]
MKGLKRDVPAIFLALKDRETPIAAKALAAVTVGYALSPIDLIPDFIPLLGYLDDVILLPAMVALTIKLVPSPVLERCRRDAESIWENGKPRKWYYALPIVLVWVLVIVLVCRALFGL